MFWILKKAQVQPHCFLHTVMLLNFFIKTILKRKWRNHKNCYFSLSLNFSNLLSCLIFKLHSSFLFFLFPLLLLFLLNWLVFLDLLWLASLFQNRYRVHPIQNLAFEFYRAYIFFSRIFFFNCFYNHREKVCLVAVEHVLIVILVLWFLRYQLECSCEDINIESFWMWRFILYMLWNSL